MNFRNSMGESRHSDDSFHIQLISGCPYSEPWRVPRNSNNDYQAAFEEIQKFLTSPPLLNRPIPDEPLYLNLSIGYESIASILVREDGSQQYPIYYVRKILKGSKIRYRKLDKLAMIVVHTSKKLRQYFQVYSIVVRTNFFWWKILQRPETSGRLV